MSTAKFIDDDFCFACGTKNPLGLQLQFFADGPRLCTRFRPQPQWQGFSGVVHGGLQTTVLDDLMSNHLFRLERVWVTTAELSVRFRLPVPIDQELLCSSELLSRRGRIWQMQATVALLADPERTLTTATGRFAEVARPG